MTVQEKPQGGRAVPSRLAIPLPELAPLHGRDLFFAFRAGISDFIKAPEYGLLVTAVPVLCLFLLQVAGARMDVVLILSGLVLPLFVPFVLAGFFEASRRIAAQEQVHVVDLLHDVAAQARRQGVWVGVTLTVISAIWALMALVLWYFTGHLGAGLALQAFLAVPMISTLYGIAILSLPMVHDTRLDALTAMLHSHASVRDNRFVMMLWALVVAGLVWTATWAWLVGLVIVLPVLAHTQWHIYHRAKL